MALQRLYERQLITFRDVRQLVLRVQEDFYKGNTLYVLTNFLERLPNLETLILVPYQNGDDEVQMIISIFMLLLPLLIQDIPFS